MATLLRFKVLVDQSTSQVVWLAPAATVYIPAIDPSLNPVSFSNASDFFESTIWEGYRKYKLFISESDFIIKENVDYESNEYKRIRLLRTKAIAAELVNNWINFKYQMQDFSNTRFYDHLRMNSNNEWLRFFQQELGCNELQAAEFIKFKLSEYDSFVFSMESSRLHFTNLIRNSITENEVQDVLSTCALRLLHSSVSVLKDLPSINGE